MDPTLPRMGHMGKQQRVSLEKRDQDSPRYVALLRFPLQSCSISVDDLLTFYKRVPRRRRATGQEGETNTKEASPEAATEKAVNPRRRRVQKKTIGDGQASAEADSSDDRKKPSRKALRKGPPEDGIPSTTTIYVANIPFEYTDEKVRELYKDSFFYWFGAMLTLF